ncbi:rhoptry neck protein 4, putative [Plasmodium chabaudi chabaudi]|uniref:Rhoptry neck protein 4, putative n=1 Tax=Plasmodium chabaudi chabaudi TaxID=31271 RepID=A0A1D3RVK1_PLACU|nr:rhoptry neck protein 4, putative [Plasmodium chabaudi chabaudi]
MSGLRLFYVCIFIVLSTFIHTAKSFQDNDDFWGFSFFDKNGDNNAENEKVEEGSHQNMQHTDDAANTGNEQQNVVNGSEHHANNTEELKNHEEHGEDQYEHTSQQINNEIEDSNNNNNNNNSDNTPEHNPSNQTNNSDIQESNHNDMSHQNATTENEHNTEHVPTEDTPADQAPTEQAPTEHVPTEDTPADQAPTEHVPTEDTPADQAPADQAPTEQAPTDQAPTDQAPTDQAPADQAPTEQAPTEQAPADQAPTEHGHNGEDEGEHSAEGDQINKNNNSKDHSDTTSSSSSSLDSAQFSDTTSSSSSSSGYSNLRKPVFGSPSNPLKGFSHNVTSQSSSSMPLFNYGQNIKKHATEMFTDITDKGLDSISDPHKYHLLKKKYIYLSVAERAILEIIDASKKGLDAIRGLKDHELFHKIYKDAVIRSNLNTHSIARGFDVITLEECDKILSEMFKILTQLSYDNYPKFYKSMNINKSALNASFPEIKMKILKKIGVTYSKLPPIFKDTNGNKCPVSDFIISITPRELTQRLAIMFSNWLSANEYGSIENFENNVELNVLCSGASILVQQWKYYQNILGFEDNNDHAFLGLIDELLTIDKKYSKNEEHTESLEKMKKSKVFNYCTKLMRTSGNISTIPFNHENNKTPSSSIIGSLGNLVKAHISGYYAATAQRINSYFNYSDKKNKKKTLPKVISICTLLNLTDILFNCTDPHSTHTPNWNLLKLNVLNTKGKDILNHLNNLNYLLNSENEAIKEVCNPKNDTVDKTLQNLLVLISSQSHDVLAQEVEKKGLGTGYIKDEIKNINEYYYNKIAEGEDDVEKAIFDDL